MAKIKTSTRTTSRASTKSTKTPTAKKASARSKSAKVTAEQTVGHDQIARRAYEIWQQEGQPAGQDTEHWYQAERELKR